MDWVKTIYHDKWQVKFFSWCIKMARIVMWLVKWFTVQSFIKGVSDAIGAKVTNLTTAGTRNVSNGIHEIESLRSKFLRQLPLVVGVFVIVFQS